MLDFISTLDFTEFPLTHWSFPLGGVLFYIATVLPAKLRTRKADQPRKNSGLAMKSFVFLHNLLLCVYSGYVFSQTFPHFKQQFDRSRDWTDFMLTAYRGEDWKQFSFYAWTFYLSKYYEFVDTWIIIMKGGQPGLLQTYHHVGAVITMWACFMSKTPATWVFVVYNSLIHTLMYFYYCLTTVGYRPRWKMLMTTMQIIQFLMGTNMSMTYLSVEGALRPYQVCVVAVMLMYVSVLLYLFIDFALDTYVRKPRVKAKSQ